MAAKDFQVRINNKLAVENPQLLANLFRDVSAGKAGALEQLSKLSGEKIETDVVLRVNADTGQSERVITRTTKSAREFDLALKRASKSATGSLTSLRAQARAAAQLRDSTVKYVTVLKTVRGLFGPQVVEIRKISNEWKLANAEVEKYQKLAKKEAGGQKVLGVQTGSFKDILSLGNKFTQITAAATAVVTTIQTIIGAVDVFVQRQKQIAGITLALTSFGVSSQGASDTLAQAKNTALTYGASLAQVEQAYKRLTPVILNSGGSLQQTDEVVASLTARTTALGLNTEQTGRYIEAFAQVLGKGKLQSEELNQQFSELDGALRGQLAAFVASEYGITNLEEAMKEGAITASIFTEFMIEAGQAARAELAGGIKELQARIDELNPQQILNIADTLNTISIEALGKSLGEFGKSLAGLFIGFSQLFALLTTGLPNVQKYWSGIFRIIGDIATIIGGSLIITLQLVAYTADAIYQKFFEIFTLLQKTPVIGKLIEGLGGAWNFVVKNIGLTVDALSEIDQSLVEKRKLTEEYSNKIRDVYDLYQQEKISVDQLRIRVGALRREQGLKEQIADQKAILETLKGQKGVVEGRIANIDTEINKVKEAADRRRTSLDLERQLIEAPFQARMRALDAEGRKLDDLRAKILQKYALERGQIDQLQTQATEARLAVERDELAKLEAKARFIDLSTQEGRRLDAEIKQKRASIAQTEYEIKIGKELADVKKREEKIEADKAETKRNQEDAVEDIEEAEARVREEENRKLEVLDKQKQAQQDQLDKIDEQITKTENFTLELQNALDKINEIGTAISKLPQATVNVTASEARALGGPVAGGRTYQVNELGKEAFLSASGRLSMIKAPAFGMWRAPSSGTVIPAHITEQLVDANSTYSIAATSQAPKLVSKITNTNQSQGYSQLARSQASMAVELGRLSQAVTKISSKEWVVDVNIGSGNPLLNRLKRV